MESKAGKDGLHSIGVLAIGPPYFLTVVPKTVFPYSLLANIGSSSVLFAPLPLANILTSIDPTESSPALALVIYELTLIFLLVSPDESPIAMHFVVAPLALVLLPIWPVVAPVP